MANPRIFQIMALTVMAVFYGIYFCKQYAQSRKGIKTRQIGIRKEKSIRNVEMWMSFATLAIVPIELIAIWRHRSLLPDWLRYLGFLLGLIGDGIFLTAVLTMRDSWRAGIPEKDKTEFVSNGIYRFSRNPAFLGFDCMYTGICLLFCSKETIFFSVFAIVMLHLQILHEETYLKKTFGEPYETYLTRVNRYIGRKSV